MFKYNFFDSDMTAIKRGFENHPSLCRYLSRPTAIANLPKNDSKNLVG